MATNASDVTPTGKTDSGSGSQTGDQTPGAEGKTVQQVLAEFDNPSAETSPGDGDKKAPSEAAEVTALRTEVADLRMEMEMPQIVKTVKGDFDIPDDAVKSWVMGKFVSDQKMMDLWATRHDNRATFDETLNALGRELKQAFPQKEPDNAQGNLAAAVRSARTTQAVVQDGGQDWGGMSDMEFANESRKVLRDAEAGRLSPD